MNGRDLMRFSPYFEVGIRNIYWRSPILPNIMTKVKSVLKSRSKKNSAPEASTNIHKIIDVLRGWGLGEGDLVVLHSGYRGIRAGGSSPDDIIDAFLAVIGPTGTLAMPAIPYWPEAPKLYDRMVADVNDLVFDYDPAETPAWTGAVPGAMMKRPEAVRSLHPLNTMIAIGPQAEPMMRDNLAGERPLPCGPTSSWQFVYENDCKIVAIGADLAQSLTMIHLAEDVMGEQWPVKDWYRDRKFRIRIDDQWQTHVVGERHPKWAMYYGERTLSKDMLTTGISNQTLLDGVNIEMASGVEMVNYLNSRNHTLYPYFMIPRKCRKPIMRRKVEQAELCRSLTGYRALCSGADKALLVKKNELFLYDYETDDLSAIGQVPLRGGGLRNRIGATTRLTRRMFRYGPKVGFQLDEERYLVATDALFEVNTASNEISVSGELAPGRRPLSFARIEGISGFDDMVCFGDYGSNPDKGEMFIWGQAATGGEWSKRYVFAAGEINHIHAIVPDSYRQCVWILTGDYGEGAGFWQARDNFREVKPVCRGHQLYRSCNCFPTPEGLLYATDSHLHPNSIRFLQEHKGIWRSTALYRMVGSTIYSCQLGDEYLFATAVEPGEPSGKRVLDLLDPGKGPGILARECELVSGNLTKGFRVIKRWPVDRLPKRLFGFSAIHLPSTHPAARRLVLTGAGVKQHDESTEIALTARP
ncbi:MAG: AAC(3) family N-acetyltransferase [bacterium]|nr:AAC(3) family N-acetyltransferase [bacterium]